ncbi:NAD(P)-dependent dehydrogenase (short-subunit alcohol dehydrogenase family) [Tamaricihabitans halophyticus]|uniref:NAD(P)-dependent dehydrogenase (Short-subunit alcohol dehydrogenase family) n=1 Tax=Tamaricihabitans halophyticus TaxID=1262583 RepID=A0A4R2QWG3_9PSEU|nr:SDR family NAD(P)-dependent oxidoreductase [Tamaricihabitans halophyticus]TCP53469.1 NAD(P)-dependent dehydrogenase (short-subunit alcohol dehydrogenase family) [Tamaricihabitans halophyticus]
MTDIKFDGQIAIVTGAGRGLGRTYALELARRGAHVVVNDLGGNPDGSGGAASAADAVVEEIESAGGTAVASYDSVADAAGGAAIVQRALDAFGSVDIVINNAGILRDRSFAKMTAEDVETVLGVHLHGAFHVTGPAFRVMKEKGYGRLIFTTSSAGLFGNFGQANYGAAKLGLVGLSNVLAIEGKKYGIHSNVIAPMAALRLTEGLMGPLGEFAQAELVTPLVVYLVSKECPVTHEVYSAGGGRYARAFVAVGPGWFVGKDAVPTAEEIAKSFDQIRAEDGYSTPLSATEESELLAKYLD